jgi:hypothetical protein
MAEEAMARKTTMLIAAMLASLLVLPASAQIRLFKDGQVIKIGPTKAERRARQMGVMRGAMSGRHPALSQGTAQPAPANQGIRRDVERAR